MKKLFTSQMDDGVLKVKQKFKQIWCSKLGAQTKFLIESRF